MRNEGPGNAEDARIACQRPVGELGKLAVEAGRKIVLDLADLFVDDVKIVDQPFRRRRDRTVLVGRLRQRAIGTEQDLAIVAQPGGERVPGSRSWRDPLCGREGLRVLFEALDAEEFGADGRLARPERERRWGDVQAKNGQLLRAFPLRQRRDRAFCPDERWDEPGRRQSRRMARCSSPERRCITKGEFRPLTPPDFLPAQKQST
jgi:hypothetical protein